MDTTKQEINFADLNVIREFSKALVSTGKLKTQDDLYGKDGLIPKLQKALYEAMLEGELNAQLGFQKHADSPSGNYRNGHTDKTVQTQHGDIKLAIPRDRNGFFEPLIVPKYERRINVIDDTIIGLYSKGLSLSQIVEQVKEVYQVELSESQISSITESVMEEVTKWQIRPLDTTYPIIYLDGIYVNVMENKTIIKKVVYVALGVNLSGQKELLGLWIAESEGSKFWMNVLTEVQNRGVKQVCIFCVDGLTGFPEAINAVYPKSMVQQCIVHAVRRSLEYVGHKDKKQFASELKRVYGAKTITESELALDDLDLNWSDKYPAAIKLWRDRWQYLTNFFQFPEGIRKAIYTTNAIESVNASIRKIIKNKKSFPNDSSVFKMLYLALHDCSKKWTMPIKDWQSALNQFVIKFDLDLTEINKG